MQSNAPAPVPFNLLAGVWFELMRVNREVFHFEFVVWAASDLDPVKFQGRQEVRTPLFEAESPHNQILIEDLFIICTHIQEVEVDVCVLTILHTSDLIKSELRKQHLDGLMPALVVSPLRVSRFASSSDSLTTRATLAISAALKVSFICPTAGTDAGEDVVKSQLEIAGVVEKQLLPSPN